MTTTKVTINSKVNKQIKHFFRAIKNFSKMVSISLTPVNELSFSALNAHHSCYASLTLQISEGNINEADDQIFSHSYRIPLAPFAFFMQRCASQDLSVTIEFTSFGLTAFAHPLDDCIVTYKTQFEAIDKLFITAPPLHQFPNHILKCYPEWILSILHSISPQAIQKNSVISLQCLPGVGLRLTFPGEAQSIISQNNFVGFVATESQALLVSLHEFVSFITLSHNLHIPMDLYFGSPGQPLIASFDAVESGKCEFIISTIPLNAEPTAVQSDAREADGEADLTIPKSEAEDEDGTDYEDF